MVPCGPSHRLLEPIQQQTAIGQPGQLIVVREVTRLRALFRKLHQFLSETGIGLRKRFNLLLHSFRLLLARYQYSLEFRYLRKGLLQLRKIWVLSTLLPGGMQGQSPSAPHHSVIGPLFLHQPRIRS